MASSVTHSLNLTFGECFKLVRIQIMLSMSFQRNFNMISSSSSAPPMGQNQCISIISTRSISEINNTYISMPQMEIVNGASKVLGKRGNM